jgi:hypothetical protein
MQEGTMDVSALSELMRVIVVLQLADMKRRVATGERLCRMCAPVSSMNPAFALGFIRLSRSKRQAVVV